MELKLVLISLILGLVLAKEDITKGPPPYDKPWVPGWGWFGSGNPKGWEKMHQKFLNQTRDHKSDIKIVFFGDSKTEGWMGPGHKVWEQHYPKRGGYNYGIGGDSTRQMLWRLENHELDGLSPKIVVFFMGGNNFANNYNKGTDEEIVKAQHIIFEKIHHKMPKAKIIFVAQLPRGSNDNRARDINSLWNRDLKAKAIDYLHVLNIYSKLLTSEGKQNLKLYIGDHIHLNEDGYKLLAENLEPLIKEYLK